MVALALCAKGSTFGSDRKGMDGEILSILLILGCFAGYVTIKQWSVSRKWIGGFGWGQPRSQHGAWG